MLIETEAPVACACDGGLFIWRRCNLNGVHGFEMGCAVEHDIVLTQDMIFDYLMAGKKSPVLKLNY